MIVTASVASETSQKRATRDAPLRPHAPPPRATDKKVISPIAAIAQSCLVSD
jgi:hypothetical protein